MAQNMTVRSLVVPALPPIDKYVAAKRVMLDWRKVPSTRLQIEFCNVNIPTPEHYKVWDRGNRGSAILIDVGDRKYHHGYMSASEMVKMESPIDGGSTWNRMLELVNKNNTTGFLKQRRHAVAKMIREIPHVFGDRNYGERETWTYGMDVVDSFFWRMDRRNWEDLFNDSLYADLRQLWEGFGVNEEEVQEFTLPLYFRRMFRSGRPAAEIMQKMSWWLDHAKQVARLHDAAHRKEYRNRTRTFELQGTEERGGIVHIADYFEAGGFNYKALGSGVLALAVLRNRFGGAVIMCSNKHRVNFHELCQELARKEPNRWYFEGRFESGQMVMNQSWQFIGVTPTSLTDDELIVAVAKYAKYEGRKERQTS